MSKGYRNINSFDGKACKFDNTKFKYEFKQYCEKGGYTQKQVLDDLSEQCNVPIETIRNWLKNTKPVDGIISKDGKLDENAIVVKLAKFFKVNVKDLLEFTKKGEKNMNLVKENINISKEKYNDTQIRALEKLNDVVTEYMILKCHLMDNVADEFNYMEYFNYSKLVDDKFNTFQRINEDAFKGVYVEPSEKQKQEAKEKEIKRLKAEIEKKIPNENEKKNFLVIAQKWVKENAQKALDNIDEHMEKLEKERKENYPYIMKYGVNDAELAHYIDDKCQDNSAYGYTVFEIEKASTLLRKEFIDMLKFLVENLYNVYDDCNITKEDFIKWYLTDKDGKVGVDDIDNFHVTDIVKDLFAQEFSLYC